MEKTALVLEGGGVRGAYTAGALAWLQDNNIHFDYNVGISSGAIYLVCHMLGEKDTAKQMATEFAADPELVGMTALRRCGYYVDYRMIFEDYIKGKCHLNMQPIIDQKMPMEVGAYDLKLGKTVYFSSEEMDPNMDIVRGSCALPIASEVVEVNGRRLLDGGITKMIPIERAMEKKCTKFLVITTKPADYVRKPANWIVKMLMKRIYKECPQVAKDYQVRHLNYYTQRNIIDGLVSEGKAVNIYPTVTIQVSRWKGDKENCTRLYNLGYADMEARKDEILGLIGNENA